MRLKPTVKIVGKRRQAVPPVPWNSTAASTTCADRFRDDELFRQGISIVTRDGDIAKVGAHVILKIDTQLSIGRLIEILKPDFDSEESSLLLVRLFEIGQKRHPTLDVPVLKLTSRQVLTHAMVSPDRIVQYTRFAC